jgi:hypothetical protein
MRNYSAARWVWGLAYYLGVLGAVLGFLGFGIACCVLFSDHGKERAHAGLVVGVCGGTFAAGVILVAVGDLLSAVIDTASNTQEMLALMRTDHARK